LTKDTWALQLKYWADKKWKFRLYYIQIKNKAVVKEFEAAISDALKPLVGKREK
jgi:t-SNARE complex subunit (syntaxin)